MEGLLFGVERLDTVAVTAAPALLLLVSLIACLLPALRAAATPPVEALPSERVITRKGVGSGHSRRRDVN